MSTGQSKEQREVCFRCGKVITARATANIFQEKVACTPCNDFLLRQEALRKWRFQEIHRTASPELLARAEEVGVELGYSAYPADFKYEIQRKVESTPVAKLPPLRKVMEVQVVAPEELIAGKVIAYQHRLGSPKSGTDWRDIAILLLRFPKLKSEIGPVRRRLIAAGADAAVLSAWDRIVKQRIAPQPEEDEF
jgi:hypothetical protein